MDANQLHNLLQGQRLSKDQLIEVLTYIDEQVSSRDTILMGLSQPRLMANFHAFAQIALSLVKGESDKVDMEWIKEASYGLDSASRREVQSD
jgi:hypothetical protein